MNPEAPREPREGRSPRNGERGERGGRGRNADRSERTERPARSEDGRPPRDSRPLESIDAAGDPQPVMNAGADAAMPAEAGADGQAREKRSRDRYGRERGPRSERIERNERGDRSGARERQNGDAEQALDGFPPANQDHAQQQAIAHAVPVEPIASQEALSVVVATPAGSAVKAEPRVPLSERPRETPVNVAHGQVSPKVLPKVQGFNLPVADLVQVAQGSGLSWVNSDPAKIAAVQSAIAAEPKQVHVPRERPASVQIDAGPLILVETKRDLRDLKLPFEETSPEASATA